MGGKASGRFPRDGHRICADECLALSLDALTTRGLFEFGSLELRLGDATIGKVHYATVESRVVVAVQPPGLRAIVQSFETTCTARWRGGPRRWLVCPICQRRAAKVCLPARPWGQLNPNQFVCRRCRHLRYRSALTFDPFQVANLRLGRLAKRMGATLSLWGEFPTRPKGMHHTTYERHYAEYRAVIKEVNRIVLLDALKQFPDLMPVTGGPKDES